MLGHYSQDPILLDVFNNGKDLHSILGCRIWNSRNPDNNFEYEEFNYCRNMTNHFQDADGNIVDEKLLDTAYVDKLYNDKEILSKDPDKLREDAEYGKKFEKVRKYAKSTTFGVIYGISKYGLAEQLETTEDEAQYFIDSFYDVYKGVHKWINDVGKFIVKNKYVQTLLGRKRRLYPYVDSGEWWMLSKARRMGVNAVVQGKK